MKNGELSILIYLCMISLSFGKLNHGIGIQMTTDGVGAYYKQLWPLSNYTKLIGDAGIHFENSQPSIDMFGYNYNYQSASY